MSSEYMLLPFIRPFVDCWLVSWRCFLFASKTVGQFDSWTGWISVTISFIYFGGKTISGKIRFAIYEDIQKYAKFFGEKLVCIYIFDI